MLLSKIRNSHLLTSRAKHALLFFFSGWTLSMREKILITLEKAEENERLIEQTYQQRLRHIHGSLQHTQVRVQKLQHRKEEHSSRSSEKDVLQSIASQMDDA